MRWRFWVAMVPLALSACAVHGAEEGPHPTPLVLRGVTVIDGTGARPVPKADVVIADGRIVEVGPTGEVRLPRSARVLDLPGRYVVAGFVDTHAHATVLRWERDSAGTLRSKYDRGVSERALRLLLMHGITTIRNPAAPTDEGVALRDAVARGEVRGPRIVTAGDALANGRMSEEDIRTEVRRQSALGVDLIKLYTALRPSQVAAAIDEAHALGIGVVGHLQRTTWTEAARLGIDAITHGVPWSAEYLPQARRSAYRETMIGRLDWLEWVDLDGPEIREMIRTLVGEGIPVDPTLIAYHTKFFGDEPRHTDNPNQRRVPEIAHDWHTVGTHTEGWTPADYARAKRLWPKLSTLVRRYYEAGVLLTAGSDTPIPWVIPGVGFHDEMELLADAGIPPENVLQIATRNGAQALGLLKEIGTIERGKRADLVVLAADPTEDIRNTRAIELVIYGGRTVYPPDVDAAPGRARAGASTPAALHCGSTLLLLCVAGRLTASDDSFPRSWPVG